MATNYSSYSDVPWYRQNGFALLLGVLFAPPLLYITLSGDIYYQRNGELRTYSGLAKGVLFFWAVVSIIVFAASFASKDTLNDLFDLRPKEDRFMEQLQGVWKTNAATYACLWQQASLRLICRTDEYGMMPLFEILPNGKLDSANHSIPVKYVLERMRPEEAMAHAALAQASAILGAQTSAASQIQDSIQTKAGRVTSKNWAAILKDVEPIPFAIYSDFLDSIAPCFRNAIDAGAPTGQFGLPDITGVSAPIYARWNLTTCLQLIEYLTVVPPRQVIAAMTPQLATALVTLRNVAKNPEEKFLPELVPDQSGALELSFVRQLNDSEISSMPQVMAAEIERRKSFATIGPEFTRFWEEKLAADLRKVVEKVRAEIAAVRVEKVENTATEAASPKAAE